MIEKMIVDHCSPTLASLKTANLFTYKFNDEQKFEDILSMDRLEFAKKGLYMTVLNRNEKRALIYVFRYDNLKADLEKNGVMRFLKKYGYESSDVPYALAKLKERFRESDEFPHEIGLFLGYPLGDVFGFVKNRGKNCKSLGCWKVYCNQCEAEKRFRQYEKCRRIYKELYLRGHSINKLTVASRRIA